MGSTLTPMPVPLSCVHLYSEKTSGLYCKRTNHKYTITAQYASTQYL